FVYATNASGMYRYDMNDIVEVAGHHERTPLIRFVQKGKGVVSFTGEKLYEVQVLTAVDQALAPLRGRYHFIAAVAELVDGTPRLVFLVEFDDPVGGRHGSALVDRLDAALGDQNDEYRTKRRSLRYGAPVIRAVRPGEYDRYRRRMVESGQRADGQFKILRLTSDTSFPAEFAADGDLAGGPPPPGGRRPGPGAGRPARRTGAEGRTGTAGSAEGALDGLAAEVDRATRAGIGEAAVVDPGGQALLRPELEGRQHRERGGLRRLGPGGRAGRRGREGEALL